MWFVFLGIGFAILIVGGLYLRSRIARALAVLGASSRWTRVLRYLMTWLLFGYPLIAVSTVVYALVSGKSGMGRYDGPVVTWLLVYPFFVTLLVLVQSLPWLLTFDLARALVRLSRWLGLAPAPWPRASRVIAGATLLVVGGFALYTPARIVLERGQVRTREYQVAVGAGAPQVPPFRIAFLADLQQDVYTGPVELAPIIERLNAMRADVVLSGGDWINSGPDHIEAAAVTASALRGRLGTYSVRGDHEHFAYFDRERSVAEIERALAARGVPVLANEVRWFQHHGRKIGVLFLNYNYIVRTEEPKIRALVAELEGADASIVVSHQFDERVAALVAGKVDLVLAAHTHGGQVNPFLGWAHRSLARVETRYVDGRYSLGGTEVIVTAGVGYSVVPFRYASPGSIELVELTW